MYSGEIVLAPQELHLQASLISGQAFRWSLEDDGWWTCVLTVSFDSLSAQPVYLRLSQQEGSLFYAGSHSATVDIISDYLRLNIDLSQLSAAFSSVDSYLASAIDHFPGLRLLRQDPIEALFSFICTAAAPLHRIRRNINGLCRRYGEAFEDERGRTHYAFPAAEALAVSAVEEIRQIGLGYRARYLKGAAQQVMINGGRSWLLELRSLPYQEAKAALLSLPGVGEKIADCICLFALDKDMAIPIDTHILRIAQRDYGIGEQINHLTPAAYKLIGDQLRQRFGPYAGWAQQFLFYHELYGKGSWEAYAGLWAS